jgi:hypothetical protein
MSHKHHQHSSVDLKKQRVRLGSETYVWEDLEGSWANYWYRISKTLCRKDLREVPFVPEEKRNSKRHEWDDVLRPLDDHKRKDERLIKKLRHLIVAAEEKQEHDRRKLQKAILAAEELTNPAPSDSASASDSPKESVGGHKLTPWQKHEQKGPAKKGQRVERTKYGVRLWNVDGTTYWDVCVNNSTKHPGNSAVRMTLPPPRRDGKKFHMAVFDFECMEAWIRELSRRPTK